MIVVNARFLTQEITGVQRFAIEISKRLPSSIKNEKVVFVTPHRNVQFNNIDAEIIPFGKFRGNLWEQIDLVTFLKKNGSPLLINFGGIGPIYYTNKVIFIHDLAFKHYPENFSFWFQKAYNYFVPISAINSRLVLTVSNFVKEDLKNNLGITNSEVIYPSIDDRFVDRKLDREKIILTVSSLDPRKNLSRLIDAFLHLNTSYKLVIVGAESNIFARSSLNNKVKNSNIQFIGHINDDELIAYYNRASIFVYPSIFEGFGIPPLEAQACGCPCVVSNVSSLPEVYEDSVLYFNPFDVEDISEKLNLLIEDHQLRNTICKKGEKNHLRFSWLRSAEKLVSILEDL